MSCQLCKRLCSNPDHLHGLENGAVHLCGCVTLLFPDNLSPPSLVGKSISAQHSARLKGSARSTRRHNQLRPLLQAGTSPFNILRSDRFFISSNQFINYRLCSTCKVNVTDIPFNSGSSAPQIQLPNVSSVLFQLAQVQLHIQAITLIALTQNLFTFAKLGESLGF